MGQEVELKILLGEGGANRLRDRAAALAADGEKPKNQTLRAVYYDTVDRRLARAGLALRVRREGRRWVQTVKASTGITGGLSRSAECEAPAPGGRLDLDLIGEAALRAAVDEALSGAPLSPAFETDFKRATLLLAGPHGGVVELALDAGAIRAGGRDAAMEEAEFELKSGDARDLFAVAKTLFDAGPVRFSRRNKAARGFALADGRAAVLDPPPVIHAPPARLSRGMTTEAAARDVLRACFDQIAANVAAAALGDDPEAAHQLRVGLRRFRTAASLFRDALAAPALEALSAEAKALAAAAGAARDLDVLGDEMLAPLADREPGAAPLAAAVAERRDAARAALKARLAAPETAGFVFDFGAFVEGRGWLRPGDFGQTEALAAPVEDAAAKALEKRWRSAAKLGAKLDGLDDEARHELRKRLKKLRYAMEFFADLWPGKAVKPALKSLKTLQEDFGALQDVATARAILTGPDAPAADDPAAQRAVGYALGLWDAQAAAARARASAHWKALDAARRYWR